MKKIFTLLAIGLFAFNAEAQINSFPNNEGFEAAFDTGTKVVFIPNWTGSIVKPRVSQSRIFADSVNFRTGSQALAAIPTSSTPDTITVSLDLTGNSNLSMSLWARSVQNGSSGVDTRSAILKAATSIDGGATYSIETIIGDSTVFANGATSYANYTYPFAGNTNNSSNVLLRLVVVRGAGAGQAARLVIDDVEFAASTVDLFPPTTVSAKAMTLSTVEVTFSEAVGVSAENVANYIGISGLASAVRSGLNDKVTLTFSPALTLGDFYTLTVQSVADIAGNVMTAPQNYNIIFNDNTGNVKITEIMYNDPGAGTDSLEFIEIKNLEAHTINIGGWKFNQGITYTFPSGTQILAGQYLVLSRFPANITAFYGVSAIGWDAIQALTNTGETIGLRNASDVLIDSVAYSNTTPWDSLANGYGHSLVLCNELNNNDLPGSWEASYDAAGNYIGVPMFASPGGPCVTVGITETKGNDFSLNAYPNPSSDQVTVAFTSVIRGSYTLKIVDLTGRILNSLSGEAVAGENKMVLSTSKLSNGLYLFVIESKDGKSQLRFEKQ
jgi:hypothetical protein